MYRGWRNVVPIVGLLLLTVPALVFWRLGWIHVTRAEGSLIGHGALKDTTSIYVWTLLAVVYLFWVLGLLVLGIWVMDRLGFHYEPYERPPRRERKKRRRRQAGIAFLRAQDEAARKAELAAVAREAKQAAAAAGESARPPGGPKQRGAPAKPGAQTGEWQPGAKTGEPGPPHEPPTPTNETDEGD